MTAKEYQRISAFFRKSPGRIKLIITLDRLLTGMVFTAYPLLLVKLYGDRNPQLLRCILVPFVSFVLVSLFRAAYSAKRPYESLDIKPLIVKNTKGKSFPSRHVFSVFMIGMTFFYLNIGAGLIVGGIGIVMGIVRVIGGVHFPRDVAAGAAAGILLGLLGYFLLV